MPLMRFRRVDFATSALAEQYDKFSFVHFPVYVIQDDMLLASFPIGFGQVVEFYNWRGHGSE